jgi:maleate isomerase
VLASPYRDNLHEIAFLQEAGIRVLHDRALGLTSDGFIAEPPSTWVRVVMEEADPEADGYFLSCTNIHSLDVLEELEERLGKPVVASNQAVLWHCLRLLGLGDVAPGLGRLMGIGAPAAV